MPFQTLLLNGNTRDVKIFLESLFCCFGCDSFIHDIKEWGLWSIERNFCQLPKGVLILQFNKGGGMQKKRINPTVVLVLFLLLHLPGSVGPQQLASASEVASVSQLQAVETLPLYFIENNGQLDDHVEFHLKMPGSNVLFARDSINYQFISNALNNDPGRFPERISESEANKQVFIDNLSVRFDGISERVETIGLEEHLTRFNFYQGNGPSAWVEGARSYNKVKYKNLYPRIDMIVFKSKGMLKQEYRIKKGGSVADICAVYECAQAIRVNEKGQLEIQTASGVLLEDTPISYQIIDGRKIFVATEYVVEEGNRVGFKTGDYNQEHLLVIDPSLIYSTFLGGSDDDHTVGIAIDLHLDAYVVGMTYSADFVTTSGSTAVQAAAPDMFIAKLDSTGSQLLFSTFFGGSGVDDASGIVFSWDDESPVVVGTTASVNFPTTPGAFDRNLDGSSDIFLAKFSSTGTLRFSTLFGGGDQENYPEVSLDGYGNLFIIGNTESQNFPTTAGVIDDDFDEFDPARNDNTNLFIAKFNKNLSSLQYSTLFGGPGIYPGGIFVDYAGNAFITGALSLVPSGASWIPITPGAYNTDGGAGTGDGFVASLNPTGTALNYCTYLGDIRSSSYDVWRSTSGISVDEGKAIVTGSQRYVQSWRAFIMGFDASGGNKLFERIFPADSVEYSTGIAIAVDGRGAAYALINSSIRGYYTSDDAFQGSLQGTTDLYITKFKINNGNTLYATYMGGGGRDNGNGLVVDSFGSVYVTGKTDSFDFPTTTDAYSTLHGGKTDAFIARIRDSSPTGQLHLNRYKLTFKIPYKNTNTFKKNFDIQNKGAGVVNYDISTNQNWLTVNPDSGDVRNEKDNVDVSVTAAKLKPGSHLGIVKVSSGDAFNSPQQLVVNLKVQGPTIRLKRKKYSLSVEAGSTTPIIKENKIKNKGPGKLRYKFKAKEAWLSVKPKRGVSTGEWDSFTIEANPTGLVPGIYQGIIEVISKDTVDSPFEIIITLNIVGSE